MFCTFFSFSNFSTCCANCVFCWSACWDDDTSYCHKKKTAEEKEKFTKKEEKKDGPRKRGEERTGMRCEKIKVSQNPCLWLWAKKNCEGTSNEEEKMWECMCTVMPCDDTYVLLLFGFQFCDFCFHCLLVFLVFRTFFGYLLLKLFQGLVQVFL